MGSDHRLGPEGEHFRIVCTVHWHRASACFNLTLGVSLCPRWTAEVVKYISRVRAAFFTHSRTQLLVIPQAAAHQRNEDAAGRARQPASDGQKDAGHDGAILRRWHSRFRSNAPPADFLEGEATSIYDLMLLRRRQRRFGLPRSEHPRTAGQVIYCRWHSRRPSFPKSCCRRKYC